jgi:hypothetical protein
MDALTSAFSRPRIVFLMILPALLHPVYGGQLIPLQRALSAEHDGR